MNDASMAEKRYYMYTIRIEIQKIMTQVIWSSFALIAIMRNTT